MGSRIVIFICVIFTGIISCKTNKCPSFFRITDGNYNNISESTFLIKVHKSHADTCRYQHIFNSWKGIIDSSGKFIPSFQLTGELLKKDSTIFLLLNNLKDTINYFDFSLERGDSVSVNFVTSSFNLFSENIQLSKSYTQKLDTLFASLEEGRDIFKFRFQGFGFQEQGDDLVFFVDEQRGVLGIYNSITSFGKEWRLSSVGKVDYVEIEGLPGF